MSESELETALSLQTLHTAEYNRALEPKLFSAEQRGARERTHTHTHTHKHTHTTCTFTQALARTYKSASGFINLRASAHTQTGTERRSLNALLMSLISTENKSAANLELILL